MNRKIKNLGCPVCHKGGCIYTINNDTWTCQICKDKFSSEFMAMYHPNKFIKIKGSEIHG